MTYVALLRGINVGGTGILPMKELVSLYENFGLKSVRTYIQSGNVVFESGLSEAKIKTQLERALEARMGKKVSVMVRTAAELRLILSENPFQEKEPARVGVAFLEQPPPADLIENVIAPGGELVHPGRREVYVYYPAGMGQSRLKLPLNGAAATVRNINTVVKLVAMAEG